ncbi:DUF1345 domain-containing protein [Azospirillum sp. YIM B02556]|uniref:DUF1345 domain-containing protein n=1 Tax=Azospirillum endophyticum TaxID=2800326 RepID=A0ABS1FA52_9PROT|nr:DUF1345 domain-containing protein [Azospirillum endophyticum]MBK1840295.1 DUF1345 domain-containing protein [Azospirillum endophyticum]
MRHSLNHLRNRPSLASALAVALMAGGTAAFWLHASTALLIGWDLGVAVYILLAGILMSRATVASMRRRARLLDPGKWGVLAGAVLASLVALAAIVVELVSAKGSPHEGMAAVLSAATVLLSWSFLHVFFAQHYAHDYWLNGRTEQDRSLDFPGNDTPDYLEFLYFSFTVGMTAQVSDVTTRSAGIRRLVLMHGALSFLFNTAVLALGVNLAAGLVS